MNDIALVTANFGGIDDVKPLPPHEGVDAFYYTDDVTRSRTSGGVLETWTQVLVPSYPRHDFGARLRSRYFKHQIHRLEEVRKHRWLVWADSSLRFSDLAFLRPLAAMLHQQSPRSRLALVPHPDRGTIREEYEFICDEMDRGNEYLRSRYMAEKMTEQMADYRQRGWNLEARLFCGGFWIVENSGPANQCWDSWWDQNLRFGMMDQLSLPVVLEDHGYVPVVLDLDIRSNAHFSFVVHQQT